MDAINQELDAIRHLRESVKLVDAEARMRRLIAPGRSCGETLIPDPALISTAPQ
jgi:hypothetical protein